MTKEIINGKRVASLEESLARAHEGKLIVPVDMTEYKSPTLESVVGKPFEDAEANKETALSLANDMARALQLARESALDPHDIEGALISVRPVRIPIKEKDGTNERMLAEIAPYLALRENMLRLVGRNQEDEEPLRINQKDRLNEAIAMWREATAKRLHALELLKKGADGVHAEAELALVRRTSAQAGAIALRHQKEFSDGHRKTQTKITSETELLVNRMVDATQKEATLDTVKQLRNQLTGEYRKLTTYLEQQSQREDKLIDERDDELELIGELEQKCQRIAQEIIELKHTEPDVAAEPSHLFDGIGDEGEFAEMPSTDHTSSADQPTDDQALINARLVSEAEERLTSSNYQLSQHREQLVSIEAELNGIRDHTPQFVEREIELREIILEQLVIPTLLAVTPEVRATIETFSQMREHEKAQFEQLPKLIKDYAEAELWFNYEFAPRVVAQLKKGDPERYADLADPHVPDTGPVKTTEVRKFLTSIGIVILNRTEAFSKRIFSGTKEYGMSVGQLALDHANNGVQVNVAMMRDSSSIAQTNAILRRDIVEQSVTVGADVGMAIRELDTYIREVEAAIAASNQTLQFIGHSVRDEYRYADEFRATVNEYRAAQAATTEELDRAEAAEAQQRLLEQTRKMETRRMAGLEMTRPDEDAPTINGDNYHQALQSGAAALSAEALAKSHAVLADMLYKKMWQQYEYLDKQIDTTAGLMAELYQTREKLLEALERGSHYGHEELATSYKVVEDMIQAHKDLPVPRAYGEEHVHEQFLAATSEESSPALEKRTPKGYIDTIKRTGIAAVSWAGAAIEEARTHKK